MRWVLGGPGSSSSLCLSATVAAAVATGGRAYRCFPEQTYEPPAGCDDSLVADAAVMGVITLEEDNWDTHKLVTRSLRFVRLSYLLYTHRCIVDDTLLLLFVPLACLCCSLSADCTLTRQPPPPAVA